MSGVGHVQPVSIWQVALHPSPETALPSSHSSPVSTMPSPHLIWMHLPPVGAPASDGVSGHCQPGSVWQVDEQPSPDVVLPSSQVSPGSTTPLPQTQTLVQGFVGSRANVPGLDLADAGAAVARHRVAVVAGLRRLDDAVAADGAVEARGARTAVGDGVAGVRLRGVARDERRPVGRAVHGGLAVGE
jgi:hypothetical protein